MPNEKRHNKIHTRAKKVRFLPVPPPPLCTLTNKSAIRKYGTHCKQKIRPRTYSEKDGYPSQNDFALSVPMARLGIELIAKRTDTFLKTTSGPALAR